MSSKPTFHLFLAMITKFLSLIKFSHTVFALPFALLGYFLGVSLLGFDYVVLIQIVLCMVLARSAAMGFNRIVDREYDAQNERTAGREIPSGQISTTAAAWFVAICSVLFVVTTLTINVPCFLLSPIALAVILGYSYTKRFTPYAHLVLGVALSIAPIGAFLATTGYLNFEVLLIALMVFCWVSGFDIIFALQDEDFDRRSGLFSIPARFGASRALLISTLLHSVAAIIVVVLFFLLPIQNMWLYGAGALIFTLLLGYQHIIVKPDDLSRVNLAFGTLNGIASVLYALFAILSLLL